ncbi:MAG: hypothetical protein MI806_13525, partial [Minwuiales bacterium]|nr:hypothetical protein [Minwuiales bacterium]
RNGGCPMAALSADVAHTAGPVREVYTDVFLDLVDALAERMPPDNANPREAALATVAQCVGSMVIARAVASEDLADEVFAAGRAATRRIAG